MAQPIPVSTTEVWVVAEHPETFEPYIKLVPVKVTSRRVEIRGTEHGWFQGYRRVPPDHPRLCLTPRAAQEMYLADAMREKAAAELRLRRATERLEMREAWAATDPAAPARSIAGLAWGVRRLLKARRDWEGGTSINELARRMYADPKVLRRRLERVTTPQLEAQQRDLLAADLAVKTGASTVNLAVERFIVTHSAGEPAAH